MALCCIVYDDKQSEFNYTFMKLLNIDSFVQELNEHHASEEGPRVVHAFIKGLVFIIFLLSPSFFTLKFLFFQNY